MKEHKNEIRVVYMNFAGVIADPKGFFVKKILSIEILHANPSIQRAPMKIWLHHHKGILVWPN
jgi:hypothetical protein